MSARLEVKALRVPCALLGIDDAWAFCEAHENETEFDIGTAPDLRYPCFMPGCVAEREYLDYVLSEKVAPEKDFFTRHRALTPAERRKYLPVFLRVFPDLAPDAVRFVHYCYYDGTDAPDVYDS